MMRGGSGKDPNKIGSFVRGLFEKNPTVQKQNMAIRAFKAKPGLVDEHGNPLPPEMYTHVNFVDDEDDIAFSFGTRSPYSPTGEKNNIVSNDLMVPGKTKHPDSDFQHVAAYKKLYKIDYNAVKFLNNNKDIINYKNSKQPELQARGDEEKLAHYRKKTTIGRIVKKSYINRNNKQTGTNANNEPSQNSPANPYSTTNIT